MSGFWTMDTWAIRRRGRVLSRKVGDSNIGGDLKGALIALAWVVLVTVEI